VRQGLGAESAVLAGRDAAAQRNDIGCSLASPGSHVCAGSACQKLPGVPSCRKHKVMSLLSSMQTTLSDKLNLLVLDASLGSPV